MPKGNYQRIIESKTSTSYSQNAIESGGIPSANLRGSQQRQSKITPSKNEETKSKSAMNLSYSLSDIDENEMRDEMLDDVDLDLDNRTALNEFDKMSAGQKLYAIAQRTQELKSKAEEFDAKMKKLNDQYHFLDKDIQKQTSKLESSAATYTNKNRKY
eukprot:403363210